MREAVVLIVIVVGEGVVVRAHVHRHRALLLAEFLSPGGGEEALTFPSGPRRSLVEVDLAADDIKDVDLLVPLGGADDRVGHVSVSRGKDPPLLLLLLPHQVGDLSALVLDRLRDVLEVSHSLATQLPLLEDARGEFGDRALTSEVHHRLLKHEGLILAQPVSHRKLIRGGELLLLLVARGLRGTLNITEGLLILFG